MSYADVPESERYVYTYNTARTLEQNEELASALKLYSDTRTAQPAFEPAIDAAFRVAQRSGAEGRTAGR